VTYRDDQDALLARADALEGDLERAKAEAERLREENERLRDAAPDDAALQALAARADTAPRTKPKPAERPRPSTPSSPGDRLSIELADRYVTPVPYLLPPVVLGALALAGLTGAMWLIPVGAGGGFVVGMIAVWLVRRSRIAFLRTLPFPLDRDSLADRINDGPEERCIRVRVQFTEPVASARRATIAKAVTGAWGDATGSWDGDDLIVTTAAIASYRKNTTRRGKTYKYFVPAPFLLACRRLAVDCLLPIHAAAPIASAAFEK
jgi:hypothetical protein